MYENVIKKVLTLHEIHTIIWGLPKYLIMYNNMLLQEIREFLKYWYSGS